MARGTDVNLLTISLCLGDVAAGLFWVDLRRPGNSRREQRTALIQRFLLVFGKGRIGLLSALL
jgi:hypothetical protein